MYAYGELNTFKAMINVATGDKLSKNVQFDFYQPLKEFSTINRFVDKAIKMSGMVHIDKFFKDVGMEAAFMKAQKMDKEAFVKEWTKAFGEEGAAQVYQDIQDNKITEDVEYYLYSAIANFQPVGLSEMPEWFNRGGNARIFYLLKSYSLSMANNFYRETIKKMRNGEVKQGLTNLAHLGTLFLLAGASTDWLVDWINGKNPDFTESMIDTFLTLGLMSRYSLDKGTKEGYAKALTSNILPPTGLLDYPTKSIVSLLKPDAKFDWDAIRLMPMVGSILYGQVTSTGVEKSINDSKRRLYEEIRDTGKVDYEKVKEINRRVKSYNTGTKPTEKLQQITPGTISAQRKKGLKEQQGM
jgi:hypothetical protein